MNTPAPVLLAPADQNLIISGCLGAAQFALARSIAEVTRLPLIDATRRVEDRVGMSRDALRTQFGEAYLKRIEAQIISEIVLCRASLIHIDGAMLLHGDHLPRLATTGVIMALVASLDAVLSRLHLTLGARYHDPEARSVVIGALRHAWSLRSDPRVQPIDCSYRADADIVRAAIERWRAVSGVIDWRL